MLRFKVYILLYALCFLLNTIAFNSYAQDKDVNRFIQRYSSVKVVGDLSVGETLNVPEWQWVESVWSIEQINSNHKTGQETGERCVIKDSGHVKILGFSTDQQRALVRYYIAGYQGGSSCASKTIFFLNIEKLSNFNQRFKEIQERRRQKQEEISVILDGESKIKSVLSLEKNQKIKVPYLQWVEVVEEVRQQFRNGTKLLELENRCIIDKGGEVTVLEFSRNKEKALVQYFMEDQQMGTHCPDNTKFFLNVRSLARFDELYNRMTAFENWKAQQVESILKGESKLRTSSHYSVGDTLYVTDWQWVDVEKPIVQHYRNGNRLIEIGDSCGLKERGQLTLLGFTSSEELALLQYSIEGIQLGTPCPSGTIFFSRTDQLDRF